MARLRLLQRHAGLCRRRLAQHSIPLPHTVLSEPEPLKQLLLLPHSVWAWNRRPQATYMQRRVQIQS